MRFSFFLTSNIIRGLQSTNVVKNTLIQPIKMAEAGIRRWVVAQGCHLGRGSISFPLVSVCAASQRQFSLILYLYRNLEGISFRQSYCENDFYCDDDDDVHKSLKTVNSEAIGRISANR